MEKETYGTIKIVNENGVVEGTKDITGFLQMDFKDGRHITCMELSDGCFSLSIENPISSGRNPQQVLNLTKESFIALGVVYNYFLNYKFGDITALLNELEVGDNFTFAASPDLLPKNNSENENNEQDGAGVSGACGF